MKGIGVTRIAKGVGFKGVWDELGQGGFQGLPVTEHLRLALVFAWGMHCRRGLISLFQEFFD